MGLCFCGIGSSSIGSSTTRSPTKKEADPECGLKLGKFLNPRNFWNLKIKQEQASKNNFTSNKVLTLEDLILSSPAFNEGGFHGSDHSHALKQSSNRRVHPSFDAEIKQEKVLIESKESFSVEIAMKTEEGGHRQSNSSTFHRSRSGKLKKVSFRSPEVTDIFILEDSHEVHVEE